MDRVEKNGQVFTPTWCGYMILDMAGYFGQEIVGKRVLEPSFGDGAILMMIVKRLLIAYNELGYSSERIKSELEYSVYGVELDPALHKRAINKLNNMLMFYGISGVKWNLYNEDFFDYKSQIKYDFILGNPPYITLKNMNKKDKANVEGLTYGGGNTDIYIGFFEKSLNMLTKTGVLSFVTPNKYLVNKSQQLFREYLVDNNLIRKVHNFESLQVFDNATVYVAITVLSHNPEFRLIEYSKGRHRTDITHFLGQELVEIVNTFNALIFLNEYEKNLLSMVENAKVKLSDIAEIKNGIATNCDKVFIANEVVDGDYYKFGEHLIEKEICRKIVKATKPDEKLVAIFPYVYDEKYKLIEIETLKSQFPNAYKYLLENKSNLLNRDFKGLNKETEWYAYARSQGVQDVDKGKLTISKYIDPEQETLGFKVVGRDELVYSGLYVVPNAGKLLATMELLNRRELVDYLRLFSSDVASNYKFLNTNSLKNFGL